MRIAAACLSVKQAVNYAADPGRAVKGVVHKKNPAGHIAVRMDAARVPSAAPKSL